MDATTRYPRLIRRVQAVLIDGVIIPVLAIFVVMVVGSDGYAGSYAAFAAVLAVFLLEPFLVTATGGTIGHHLRGIRVLDSKTMSGLGILRATLRFIVKTIFGIFSLIVVLTSRKHQAIHDYLSRSIVVVKNPVALPDYEALKERQVEKTGYVYPSRVRRTAIMVLYSVLLFLLHMVVLVSLMTEACLIDGVCSGYDHVMVGTGQMIWLGATAAIIVFGWRGRLWGADGSGKMSLMARDAGAQTALWMSAVFSGAREDRKARWQQMESVPGVGPGTRALLWKRIKY
jgi:uncharacterized RDD family membrane protein YckC